LKIAVTGANSSVGLNLLGYLHEREDIEVVACVRSERAAGEIPESPRTRVQIASYDDRNALSEALAGATCVVHLAGILLEGRGTSYESANVDTAVAVAGAAVAAGAEHLVLISVVGADPESANRYFRTKGMAERAVAESGAPATIVRTPILLGPGTAGAFSLARTVRRGRARLLGGGGYTMRPLDVDDLSEAIVRICRRRPAGVALHELVGPEPVTYRALIERAGEVTGTELSLGSTPIWLAKAGAAVRSKLAGGGVTPTVIDVITKDEVVEKNADVELGVMLTPLAETLRRILPAREGAT
jgi:uncharacterized protein YbjT (DUF2867 family)